MAKNTEVLPFTEIVERTSELARIREDVEKKIRGVVNDFYIRDLTKKEDWSFLISSTSVTMVPEFTTGSVSANTGSVTATFSSDVTITSAMTGRKIKVGGNDYVYRITMAGTTAGNLSPAFGGTQNASSQSYSIFQNIYPLVADFDRFPKNGGLHRFEGGQKVTIPEKPYQYFTDNFNPNPNDTAEMCRLLGADTAGNQLMELSPPPKNEFSLEYDYLKRLRVMRETTAGLILGLSAGATAVVGNTSCRFLEANTGDFLRIDAFGTGADSEWYRIISITHNSALTIQTAFGSTAAANALYTISASPDMPVMMHPALLYGALLQLTADQDDPMYQAYYMKLAEVLTDGKRLYKTRDYKPDIETIAEDYHYRR